MIRPENRPLPELPAELLRRIELARAKAQAVLNDDLNACWTRCFPIADVPRSLRTPEPQSFFEPFIAYGIALYDAFAKTLLKLSPELSDYLDWLDFRLKTEICYEIAPLWPADRLGELLHPFRSSAWESWMQHSWRLFDHPQHRALEPKAQKLFRALRDPLDNYWNMFFESLHKALSRKTPHWRAEGLRKLRKVGEGIHGARRGYRTEVRKWMKDQKLKTIPDAATRLGIGFDTLKSIMSSRGEKRYGDETLAAVLKKIGHSAS